MISCSAGAAELAPEPLPQRRRRVDRDRPQVLGELDLLLAPHALAGEGARDAVLLGDLAHDRAPAARGRREPQRRRDRRLADAALARHVEQRAVQQSVLHASDSMTGYADGPVARPRPTRRAGACSGATTRPTTGRRGGCRPRSGRPRTRSTATCAPPTRSSTARAGRRAPRRGGRRWTPGSARWSTGSPPGRSPHPVVGALVDAGLPPPAAARRAAHLHALDADRLRARADRDVAGARGLHGRLGRLGRAHHGPAARRARRAITPAFGRLGQAFQLTNFIRDLREDTAARPHLPARRRARALRRGGGGPARASRASPELRALVAFEVRRARGLFAEAEPAVAAAPRLACARASASPSRVYRRVLDRVGAVEFDVLGRRAGVRAWQLPGAAARGAAPVTRRATLRGADRDAAGRRRARADVLICGACFAGLAVARELRGSGRRRARRRPLRDRRAPDVGLRGADAVAARRWACERAIRQELPCMAFHTPHGSARFRLPWSWSAFDYRTLCEELWAQCARAVRDREGRRRRTGARSSRTDRGAAARPARRRRARLAPRARPRRRTCSRPRRRLSRGLEVHPRRAAASTSTCGSTARSSRRGYAWSVPAAGEQRVGVGLVRAAPPREGADAGDRRPARRPGRPLPGQLVPARAAPGRRGRRVLRRRQRRPLLPALGRGHPHRVLLRHRLRA